MRTRFAVTLMLLAAGCSKSGSQEQAPPMESGGGAVAAAPAGAAGDPAAKAKEIFQQRCTPCHGPAGEGDGPASAGLNPKPRKFSDAEWQKSVNDDHLVKVIRYGGAAVGKSAAMPGNPDLSDPAVIAALKDVVRAFSK
ncbi:MAG: c-type cytochrome [Myxococcales bacterium]|nr:c-type cytochrome [Myxococcales bacterium]